MYRGHRRLIGHMEGQPYPDECVKTHYRPSLDFRYPDEKVKKHFHAAAERVISYKHV